MSIFCVNIRIHIDDDCKVKPSSLFNYYECTKCNSLVHSDNTKMNIRPNV